MMEREQRMANGASLLANRPFRGMLVGYPGAGKTGALVCLLNAGFKLRILDYDGNLDPLLAFANPAMLKNLDAVRLQDKMGISGPTGTMEPVGIPQAYATGVRLLDNWRYPNPDGSITDLGASKDWGSDTIVVLDSTRTMGDAAYRRAMKMSNKTLMNTTDRVYNLSMTEQQNFLTRLANSGNRFHVIIMSHLKMISPKEPRKGDSPITEKVKEQIAEILPTRLYPWVLGWQLPQTIAGDFSTILEVVSVVKAHQVKRVIRWAPRTELDLKLPADMGDLKELPIETGMLEIFKRVSPASVAMVQASNTQEGTTA